MTMNDVVWLFGVIVWQVVCCWGEIPVNTVAIVGSSVQLNCSGPSSVWWYKEDLLISNNTDVNAEFKPDITIVSDLLEERHLRISKAALSHDGKYSCKRGNNPSVRAALVIIEQPHCSDNFSKAVQFTGEIIALRCVVSLRYRGFRPHFNWTGVPNLAEPLEDFPTPGKDPISFSSRVTVKLTPQNKNKNVTCMIEFYERPTTEGVVDTRPPLYFKPGFEKVWNWQQIRSTTTEEPARESGLPLYGVISVGVVCGLAFSASMVTVVVLIMRFRKAGRLDDTKTGVENPYTVAPEPTPREPTPTQPGEPTPREPTTQAWRPRNLVKLNAYDRSKFVGAIPPPLPPKPGQSGQSSGQSSADGLRPLPGADGLKPPPRPLKKEELEKRLNKLIKQPKIHFS